MNAGSLRHRVKIQRPTETKNARGELVTTWNVIDTIWANVRQADDASGWTVEIRWRDDLTKDDRLAYSTPRSSHTLRIDGIADPEQQKKRLLLTCSEPDYAG